MGNEFSPQPVVDAWKSQDMVTFRMSLEAIRNKSEAFDKKIRRRNFIGSAACMVVVAGAAWWIFQFPNLIQRIGSLLTILGSGYLLYQLRLNHLQKTVAENLARRMGETASVEFYRGELERQRDFHRGLWFWSRLVIFVPGPLVFIVGFQIAHPELVLFIRLEGIVILGLAILAVPLNLRLARKYQQEIDTLTDL